MGRMFLLILIISLYGCGSSKDEQAQIKFASLMQSYHESSAANKEKLDSLMLAIDRLLKEYENTKLAQELLRGEPIILGKSLGEIKQNQSEEQKAFDYSEFFLSLVKEQCLQHISALDTLKSRLEKNESFRPVSDVEGSFEIHYRDVSFAITPEVDLCTVDVMLKNEYHDILFSKNHIDGLLMSLSASSAASFMQDEDMGSNGNEVKVLRKSYKMTDGINLKLVYPVTGLDEFYMYVDIIPLRVSTKKM